MQLRQSGAEEACWAHNSEVDGSKPTSTNLFNRKIYFYDLKSKFENVTALNKKLSSAEFDILLKKK